MAVTLKLRSPEVGVEVAPVALPKFLPRPLPAGHKRILITHDMWREHEWECYPITAKGDRRDCTEAVNERTDLCTMVGASGAGCRRFLRYRWTSPGAYITRMFLLRKWGRDYWETGKSFLSQLCIYDEAGMLLWASLNLEAGEEGEFVDVEVPVGIFLPPGTYDFELRTEAGTLTGWAEIHCAAWEIQYWTASLSLDVDKEKATPGEELTFSGKVLVKDTGKPDVDVKLYRQGVVEGTATTDEDGNYSLKVKAPTEAGTYTYHSECTVADEPVALISPEITVKVVPPELEEAQIWTFFEGDPEAIKVAELFDAVRDALAPYPYYVLRKVEVNAEHRVIIFTLEVPASPIAWAVILPVLKTLIIAIAAILVVWGVKEIISIIFYPAGRTYGCPICGVGGLDYLAFVTHMATEHPEAWERIKPFFEKIAPRPVPWGWIAGGLLGVVIIGFLITVWPKKR